MNYLEPTKSIIKNVLSLDDNFLIASTASTPLLGSIPEFDSMAVVSLITILEDEFDIFVEDDEISAETFETIGTLVNYIERKMINSP